MSDSNNKAVNFSKPINYLNSNFAKVFLSIFYYPILIQYQSFLEKLEEAENLNEEDTSEIIEKCCEAIDEFHHKEIKTFVNDAIIEMSSAFVDGDEEDDFFEKNYPELVELSEKFETSETQIQNFRNRLFNYFKIANNELNEMARSYSKIEHIFEKANDSNKGLRNGWTGGLIGGTIGSFLLPGIGTVVGAAGGAYFMNQNDESKAQDKFFEEFSNYTTHSERVINLLGSKARELYKILEKFSNNHYRKNIRGLYKELKNKDYDADQIMTEYFQHEVDTFKKLINSKMDEDDPQSPTFQEVIDYTHEFVAEFNDSSSLPNH